MEWRLPPWTAGEWLTFGALVVALLGGVGSAFAWRYSHVPKAKVRAFLVFQSDSSEGLTEYHLSVTVTNVRPVPVHLDRLRIDLGEGRSYLLANRVGGAALPQRLEQHQSFRWIERLNVAMTDPDSPFGIPEDAWVGKPRRFRVVAGSTVHSFRSPWMTGRLYDHS